MGCTIGQLKLVMISWHGPLDTVGERFVIVAAEWLSAKTNLAERASWTAEFFNDANQVRISWP